MDNIICIQCGEIIGHSVKELKKNNYFSRYGAGYRRMCRRCQKRNGFRFKR